MDLDLIDIVVRVLVGGGLGFIIGLAAVGGGVLGVPVLAVGFGLPASVAVGTASLYSLITKSYAAVLHYRQKTVDMKMTWLLLIGALPGAILTSWFVSRFAATNSGETLARFQHRLTLVIVVVMIVTFVLMMVSMRRKLVGGSVSQATLTPARRGLCVLLGLLVGAVIAATSIGAGVFMIPALILGFGLQPSRTVGTSIMVSTVLTLATTLMYGGYGQLDIPTALFMSIGSLVGAPLGGKLTKKLPERRLQTIIVGVIVVAITVMIIRLATAA
ncbi:MAG: putative membrane protein YfcA [Rhodothermales bacterium]|jgi:uncharacterized membrane protein YfcA